MTMGDNQQMSVAQQQQQRPVGELIILGLFGAGIGLGVAWGLKQLFPESMPN